MFAFALHLFLIFYIYRLYHKTMITLEPGFTIFLIWFHQLWVNLYWLGDLDLENIKFLSWWKFWVIILIIYIYFAYLWFHVFHRFVFTRSGTADTCLKPIFLMQDMIRRDINKNLTNEYPEFLENEWYNTQIKYSKKIKFDLINKIKIHSIFMIFLNIYFLYIIYIWFYLFLHLPLTAIFLNFEKYYFVIFLNFFKFFFFLNLLSSFIAPNTNFCWVIYYFSYEPFELYSDLYRRHENNEYILDCYGKRDFYLNWSTVHKCAAFIGLKQFNQINDDWNYLFSSRSIQRYHLNKTWYSCYNSVIDCFVNNYYFNYYMLYQWILKLFFFPWESYAGDIYDKKRKMTRKYFYHENFFKILLFGRNFTTDHDYDNSIKRYKIK